MKKLLMGSIVLTVFSTSMLLFQVSCKKDANAQTSGTTGLAQLNKIIYRAYYNNVSDIYTSNYDGSNRTKVNIILPAGVTITNGYSQDFILKLSPDGKTIFFSGVTSSSTYPEPVNIYSCNIDGSNVNKITGTLRAEELDVR